MPKKLTLPLSDEDIKNLKAGESVLLSGTMLTGRDAAQKILEAYDIVYLFLKDVLDLDEQSAKDEAEKIKLVTTDETINKLAKYVHNVLGLKELNCNYDINQEKCRCCVKRAKTKKSNDMQN